MRVGTAAQANLELALLRHSLFVGRLEMQRRVEIRQGLLVLVLAQIHAEALEEIAVIVGLECNDLVPAFERVFHIPIRKRQLCTRPHLADRRLLLLRVFGCSSDTQCAQRQKHTEQPDE